MHYIFGEIITIYVFFVLILKCEPALWDAKHFTAQRRARYFWGNIPDMYWYALWDRDSIVQTYTHLHTCMHIHSDLVIYLFILFTHVPMYCKDFKT